MHQDRSAVPYAGQLREQVFAVFEQAGLFTGVNSALQHAVEVAIPTWKWSTHYSEKPTHES